MTRKEAIKKVLRFEPVSPAPYNLDFTRPMRARLAEHFGNPDVDEAVGNCILPACRRAGRSTSAPTPAPKSTAWRAV